MRTRMSQVIEEMSLQGGLVLGVRHGFDEPLVMNGPKSFVWICLNHQRRFFGMPHVGTSASDRRPFAPVR